MLEQSRRKKVDNSTLPASIDSPVYDPLDLGAMMALKDAPSELDDTPPLNPIEVSDIIADVTSDMADLVLEPVVIEMISQPHLKPPQIIDFSATGNRVVVEVELALNYRSVDLQEVQTPKQASPPSSDIESSALHRSDDEQSSSDSSSRPPYRADLATVVNHGNWSEVPLRRRTNARFIDFYESSISYFGNYGSKRLLLADRNDPSYTPNARRGKKRVRQRRTTIHKGRHNTPLIRTPASGNEQHRELPQADESSTDQLAGPSTSRALSTNPTRKRRRAPPNYLPVQDDLSYVPPSLIRKKMQLKKRRIMQTGRSHNSPSINAPLVSPEEISNSAELDQAIGQRIGSAAPVYGDDDESNLESSPFKTCSPQKSSAYMLSPEY